MTGEAEFYLASSEGYEMENPRRCWRVKRLRTENRDDLLLVKIEPPVIWQKYGLGGRDIDLVLLAPQHAGRSLLPVTEWPLCVHVARPLVENLEDREALNADEFELIAWAELYRTEEEARN